MRIPHCMTFATLTLVTLFTAACSAGPQVRIDKDPAADMQAPRTFAFISPVATDRMRYTTLLTTRVKQATREQLERQGYTYSEENPDLRVNFMLQVENRQEVRTTPTAGRNHSFYRTGYGTWSSYNVETENYRQGTLVIHLVDAKRSALVWQGVAEGRISEKAMKDPGPAIDRAVAEIFTGFPAKKSG